MVRYTDSDELDETKPHRIPDLEDQTQPGKAVSSKVPVRRTPVFQDGGKQDDTQPTIENTSEEQLAVLSKVLSERPDHPQARRGMYLTMYRYLRRNPFLRYLEENDVLYSVITGQGRVIAVPKDR